MLAFSLSCSAQVAIRGAVGQDRTDEARMTAASFGKMPTTWERRLISRLSRSSGLVDQIFLQCALGKALNARTSAFASSISGPTFGNRPAIWSRTCSQVVAIWSGSGWAKMVRNTAA